MRPYVEALQAAGYQVWWDRDVAGGEAWHDRIDRELKRSHCVVLFWSPHSVLSPWVRIEAFDANRRSQLMPVQLEPCNIPAEFLALQVVDVSTETGHPSTGTLSDAVGRFFQRRRRRLASVVATGLLVVLALAAALGCGLTGACAIEPGLAATDTVRKVGVLRFDYEGESAQERAALTLALLMARSLSRTGGLWVSSQGSILSVPDNASVDAAADQLGVDVVVSGKLAVTTGGARLHLTLHDIKGGTRLDLPAIEEPAANLVGIAGEAAASLASVLRVSPEPAGAAAETELNPVAFPAYLVAFEMLVNATSRDALDGAIGAFTALLRDHPEFAPAYAGLCHAMFRRYELSRDVDELGEAESWCESAQAFDGEEPLVFSAQGLTALARGDQDAALVAFERALAIDGAQVDALIGRAKVLERLGRDNVEVEAAFMQAALRQPGNWRTQNDFALYYLRRGQPGRAAGRFMMGLRLHPDNLSILHNLGVAQLLSTDFDAAVATWNRVLELPEAPEARGLTYANLGAAHYLRGDYAGAIEAAEAAVALVPQDYRLLGNLADAYRAMGDGVPAARTYELALRMADRELSLNPADVQVAAGIASFEAAVGLVAARGRVEEIAAANVADPEVARLLAIACVRLGNQACALREVRRAVSLGYPRGLLETDPELARLAQTVGENGGPAHQSNNHKKENEEP